MDRLYKHEDVVQMLVDVIEQAEQNNDIVIVDRPMGWESIRDYAEEVVSDIPCFTVTAVQDTTYTAEKQGEWIDAKEYPWDKCSVCGFTANAYETLHYNFCPNCGCRMKGAENDSRRTDKETE